MYIIIQTAVKINVNYDIITKHQNIQTKRMTLISSGKNDTH